MKQKLFNSIKLVAIVGILAIGISYAFAFTGPTTTQFAPMNTGDVDQIKQGGIFSKFFLGSEGDPSGNGSLPAGLVGSKHLIKSYDAWFNNQLYVEKSVKIGDTQNIPADELPTGDVLPLYTTPTTPLTIDLVGRGPSGGAGKNVMELLSGNSCLDVATTVVNTAAIQFWDTAEQRNADIIARQVRLTGGAPSAGSVLASDANGNATWATVREVNGQIQVTYNEPSPIPDGQSCSAPAQQQTGCSNIAQIQRAISYMSDFPPTPASGIPPGFVRNATDGSCYPIHFWSCLGSTGYHWTSASPSHPLVPAVIANTNSPYYGQPYCTFINYHPGDKYFKETAVCADPSQIMDPTACSATNTPLLPGCGSSPFSHPCQ